MTFIYGTNVELLYSLPAIGATQSSSVATVLNSAATSPVLQLPALQNIWSPSQMTGKGFKIVAAGGYDISAANTLTTLRVSFDTAEGTTATNTVASVGALSGNAFGAAATTGVWQAECWMACVGITSNTASSWFAQGQCQFSGTAATGVATSYGFGNTVTAGVPQTFTLGLTTPYWVNLVAQWQASPVAMVCSEFMVLGLN